MSDENSVAAAHQRLLLCGEVTGYRFDHGVPRGCSVTSYRVIGDFLTGDDVGIDVYLNAGSSKIAMSVRIHLDRIKLLPPPAREPITEDRVKPIVSDMQTIFLHQLKEACFRASCRFDRGWQDKLKTKIGVVASDFLVKGLEHRRDRRNADHIEKVRALRQRERDKVEQERKEQEAIEEAAAMAELLF